MNVLVLGATSFVGSHVVKKLNSMGHRVSAAGSDPERAKLVLNSIVPFHVCNFGMQLEMDNILRRTNPDIVIQCAGDQSIGQSMANPIGCYTDTIVGNIFLLDVLTRKSIGKFMYLSSAAVFGEVESMPITENTTRLPISPLGNSQLFIENMLESLRISHGLSYAILRMSTATGMSEMESEYFIQNVGGSRLVSNIIDQILGKIDTVQIFGTSLGTLDNTPERDYVHVDDFCSACANVIPKLAVRGEGMVYNIGSGRKYSVREVMETAEKIFGVKINWKESMPLAGEASRIYFDISKARNELDWSPKYDTLAQILQTLQPYYLGKQKGQSLPGNFSAPAKLPK
ncbi:MAG: NAD-dependent epimerase/dehydratase family protein [Puniceicoccales bacterium]|jgi:UDP-glucose 4-epimerase|nr:NAD-dependent epimerase/dehydratase family protein [Puniceicoccales bacterium]